MVDRKQFTGVIRVEALLSCKVPFGETGLKVRNRKQAIETSHRLLQFLLGPIPRSVEYRPTKTEIIHTQQ